MRVLEVAQGAGIVAGKDATGIAGAGLLRGTRHIALMVHGLAAVFARTGNARGRNAQIAN
jgi:hypothetical protein